MIANDLLLIERPTSLGFHSVLPGTSLVSVLQESELIHVSWQPWRGVLGALFRSGSDDLEGNTLVLALGGVFQFQYDSALPNLKSVAARVVDGGVVEPQSGRMIIQMNFYGSLDSIRVGCSAADLYSGDMAGQEIAPPDYGYEVASTVSARQPSWEKTIDIAETRWFDIQA